MKYGNRSLVKRLISSPITLIVLAIVVYVLARATFNMYDKVQQSEARLAQTQAELIKLKTRQDDLSRKVTALSTDQGIEAEIRTRFHAVKEGESVAVIVDDPDMTDALRASAAASEVGTTTIGWWRRMLRMFWFSE